MADRILVTGATGLQGGAVARHLLKLGKAEVRCLTRHPDSEAAKTFKQLGADVVKADFDDPASLKPVLKGCTGVFGVTNFWEAFLREHEQGANLIDAASEAGVAHLATFKACRTARGLETWSRRMLGKANYRTLRGAVNIGMMQFAFPRTPFLDSFRVAGDSGIESLAPWAHAGLRFTREPTWPAGRKRKADQTSPMATMDTARHPTLLIASRITSRLRSPLTFDVFFGCATRSCQMLFEYIREGHAGFWR